jgi:hypothetical protein
LFHIWFHNENANGYDYGQPRCFLMINLWCSQSDNHS